MGLRQRVSALWSPGSPGAAVERVNGHVLTAEELLLGYDLVDVSEHAVIVSKKLNAEDDSISSNAELGYVSPSPWTGWTRREYNTQLVGQNGLRMYDQMRRNDATVRGSLRLLKTPVWAARWFIEPASDSVADKNIADFVWWNLTEKLTYGFDQVLEESLLCLDFGYYMFEKVWTQDVWKGRPVLCWDKLAPRHPMDVQFWKYDAKGGPDSVVLYPNPSMDEQSNEEVEIPISSLMVFTYGKEAGNMEGMSILRSAYKHWYYKEQLYKIDAIQKERHSIGVPIIILPPNFSDDDKRLANELGSNLRTNERAHVVLPPNWDLKFADVRTNLVDPLESVSHHDLEIQKNILAGGLMDESGKEEEWSFFLKNARDVGNLIARVFNDYGIKELVDLNYSRLPNGYPKLRVRRIGEETDQRTMSFAIRNLIGAQAIVPDDVLEKFLRDLMDLPQADQKTRRLVAGANLYEDPDEKDPLTLVPSTPPPAATPSKTPVLPGKAGKPGVQPPAPPRPPRVGPPRQQALPPVALPRSNGGTDRSGGH